MSERLLFILRSPPDAQGHSLGMDTALSAAAMDREVIVLLAFPRAADLLAQTLAGEKNVLRLIGAADLFGLAGLRLLGPVDSERFAAMPIPVSAVAAGELPALVADCHKVFSYP